METSQLIFKAPVMDIYMVGNIRFKQVKVSTKDWKQPFTDVLQNKCS